MSSWERLISRRQQLPPSLFLTLLVYHSPICAEPPRVISPARARHCVDYRQARRPPESFCHFDPVALLVPSMHALARSPARSIERRDASRMAPSASGRILYQRRRSSGRRLSCWGGKGGLWLGSSPVEAVVGHRDRKSVV